MPYYANGFVWFTGCLPAEALAQAGWKPENSYSDLKSSFKNRCEGACLRQGYGGQALFLSKIDFETTVEPEVGQIHLN